MSRTLCKIEVLRREQNRVNDKDHEEFVVVSSTAPDRTQDNLSDHIVSFCSEELPARYVLKNVNGIVQHMHILAK